MSKKTGEYPIVKGRFTGAWLNWARDKSRCWIGNEEFSLDLCQRNVAFFKVIDSDPFYYYRCPGYYCGIKWRDGTESLIVIPYAGVKMIEKALKKNIYPKQ